MTRPNDQVITDPQPSTAVSFYVSWIKHRMTSNDKPAVDVVYLRLGESRHLSRPSSRVMIVRLIPFIIAGLAVALAFWHVQYRRGRPTIRRGGILAALFGFDHFFASLPCLIHIPLHNRVVGDRRYAGAIPGLLKPIQAHMKSLARLC